MAQPRGRACFCLSKAKGGGGPEQAELRAELLGMRLMALQRRAERQSSDVAAPCTQEEALPPEPAPEPDATALASPPSRSQSSPAVLDWSVAELRTWLAEAMQQPAVADAAAEEELDGATALVMGKEEWKELGVSGIKAAKIVAQLTKLAK